MDVLEERQEMSHEQAVSRLSIDKGILIVFAIALLASLGVMFYLVVIDRLTAVSSVLYPPITLVISFMGGYFAGSGRGGAKKKLMSQRSRWSEHSADHRRADAAVGTPGRARRNHPGHESKRKIAGRKCGG
jgi:hypothetical protein